MPTYLTAEELAQSLRLSPDTIRQMARDKKIPAIRLSPKVIRFDAQAVADALSVLSAEKSGGCHAK